jgi:K+-transporting ATPase ATPase C chain
MTLLLGLAYPLLVTGLARLAFAHAAGGSLIYRNGVLVGSSLIGQQFSDPTHLWGRRSATTPQPYNALGSTGSNLGPLNPALIDQVKAAAKALKDADPANGAPIPVDLVTASASGLDPEVSVSAARYQLARLARVRGLAPAQLEALMQAHEQRPLLGFIGERRVNVLEFNLALDALR